MEEGVDESFLFQVITVLMHKLGRREITITDDDLHETLTTYQADRLIMCGRGHEVRIGIYGKDNEPTDVQPGSINSFH